MNENPTDDMIPFNKDYWGESYFFDQPTGEWAELTKICGYVPRNYFIREISKVARYAIDGIQSLGSLIKEKDNPHRPMINIVPKHLSKPYAETK